MLPDCEIGQSARPRESRISTNTPSTVRAARPREAIRRGPVVRAFDMVLGRDSGLSLAQAAWSAGAVA
jgi:hypothetical protein